MKTHSKRLFINNLPDNVTQVDLQQKFSDYGKVSSIEIKQRKNTGVNQTAHFAYVHIDIENRALQNCISEFSNKKWKGHWLLVEEAKESFMERLKREREEQNAHEMTKPTQSVTINTPDNINNVKGFVSNRRYHSSSSEDEQKDEGFVSADEFEITKKSARTVIDTTETESTLKNTKQKDDMKKPNSKEVEADKKRLQSIAQMKRGYQQQKSLIKSALANIDVKPKNKIIFNDDDNSDGRPQKQNKQKEYYNNSQKKLQLFNEEEDEANIGNADNKDYNFEIKEHFEGKKGQKLMALQSKFKNDKRFTLDARFLEESENEEQLQNNEIEDKEISHEDEKQKQFEILEEVLGKKISRKQVKNDELVNRAPKMMLRFDPTQPEHSKFEVKDTAKQEKKKKKETKKEVEDKIVEAVPAPEVSKDTFYKVAVDLKTTLQEKEGFSLADMFSKEIQNVVESEEEKTVEEPVTNKQTKTFVHEKNPFRYDSSDSDDDDNDNDDNVPTATKKAPSSDINQQQKPGTTKLWTESFFFKYDDYRLQEGLDFVKRLEVDDQDDFHKLRRNLKEIVRAKVKNNQRKNRPFRKKLGGKKRIKVKRALKR
ncbi:hypothetical protein ILUMI_05612 [Ignelater luminosus]|uniref:RRM domain-containing protein n=1 Tax=Ignelater luminosus TaxID=2038154 RepID=A0A8K0GDE1_IGNLU|nr:hypothetical protein ILUMI_05612 [Ignelater luminosus]